MRFYTKQECQEWMSGRSRDLPTRANMANTLTLWYPANPANIDFLWLAQQISYREPVLLWITEWGVWPSSENLHLFYKLRQSYGDSRLLHEAPDHLFQNYELDDLATFLQVAATNGWGGFVLPHAHYSSFFFSHVEYIEFFDGGGSLYEVKEHFAGLLEPPQQFHSSPGRKRIPPGGGELLTPTEVHPVDPDVKSAHPNL